jgi:outer membrane immunogenic protein
MANLKSIFAALISVAIAGPAFAADLPAAPYHKAPPPPPAVYNWTGLYFGGHIGGIWADETSTNATTTPLALAGTQVSTTNDGFLGGGQIGLNYQLGIWVIGVEADASWTNASTTVNTVSALAPAFTIGATSDINWFSTVTGRLGFASGNVLFYAKGGVAWMNVDYTGSVLVTGTNVVFAGPVTISDTRTGWTAGAGIEWGFWNNWSAKLEYDFLDFGSERYVFNIGGVATTADIDTQAHVVKAGLNYRFNWGAPVVARY